MYSQRIPEEFPSLKNQINQNNQDLTNFQSEIKLIDSFATMNSQRIPVTQSRIWKFQIRNPVVDPFTSKNSWRIPVDQKQNTNQEFANLRSEIQLIAPLPQGIIPK